MFLKVLFVGLILCTFSFALAVGEENLELPVGNEVISQVVHGVKYPLAKKITFGFGYAKYYGDRLANTSGVLLEPRYHFSEKSWVSLSVFFGSSELAAGAPIVTDGDTHTYVADPSRIISLLFGSDLIFGKFVLRDKIHYFRANLNGGPLVAQMNVLAGDGAKNSTALGFQAGGEIEVQLADHWTADLFSDLLLVRDGNTNAKPGGSTAFLYGIKAGRSF